MASPDTSDKNTTIFGTETEFSGVLEFTDNLVIAGKFDGTIKSTGNLMVATTAECSVDTMDAETVDIAGKVTGDITAPVKIEIRGTAHIVGDLETKKLRIEDNADFHGQVTMLDTEYETPNIFAVNGSDVKKILYGENSNADK
ncbi:MAG: hypothetical protein Ta2A_05210 [Treponemataceae bacterium]|nr:MAG: hypothetical protein Ta2A_05210 [Treponemataceae bacterium]